MPFKEGPRRAEKDQDGNPTYTCTWEGCDKTFGTAQHTRRHEKSHVGNTPYNCAHCDKSFVRSDVRAKHVQTMHGIGGSGGLKRERDSSTASGSTPPMKQFMSDHHGPSPTFSQTHLPPHLASSSSPQNYLHQDRPGSRSGPGSGSLTLPTWIDTTHTQHPQQQQQGILPSIHHHQDGNSLSGPGSATLFNGGTPLIGGPGSMMLPPPTPFSGTSGTGAGTVNANGNGAGFLDPSTLSSSALPLDSVLANTTDIFDPFNPNWDAFGQAFGWGFENDLDLGIGLQNSMFDNSDIGPVSSTDELSAAWLLSMTPRNGSPVGDGKGVPTMESDQRTDPFGRKHDNPWPSIFKPKVPDRPLTLGGVKASPRPHRDPSAPEAINKTARNAMLSLIYLSHQNLWLMPDIGDFPDNETLSDFVDLYFENFHPTFPILHKPTFLQGETPAVLLLSVAAVGATYAEKSVQPLAVALSELVRRIVTWMRASDQRSKFDRQALMAYTLQAALDIACGSREMFLHAEIMRSSITTTCRRLHLLRATKLAMDDLMLKDPKAGPEDRWRAYIEDEGRRRLGWGIFLLDAQMAALLGHPCMMSINEVTVPLPGVDDAWNAPSAKEWAKVAPVPEVASTPTFQVTLSRLLKGHDVQLPDYANSIVSHTFYRFLMDAYHLSHALQPEEEDGEQTLTSYLPSRLESKPRRLLLQLARTSFPLKSPTHLRLSSAALFHHSYISFARPGLMEHIKAASGRTTPETNKRISIDWLETWAENGKEVRMVLWHAGVLNALLADFPQGALSELFWTFDCALVFWAIVKYAGHRLRSTELKSALFAANWFDTEPPKVWVDHGGQLVLPYLGSSATLDLNSTLTFFMNRLDSIPWGWATLFRQVLGKLLTSDDGVGSDDGDP